MEHLQSEQLKALKGADDEMVMEILGRNSGLSVEAQPLIEGYDGPSDGESAEDPYEDQKENTSVLLRPQAMEYVSSLF